MFYMMMHGLKILLFDSVFLNLKVKELPGFKSFTDHFSAITIIHCLRIWDCLGFDSFSSFD